MPSLFANPVPAPHKTKRFWLFVALGFVPIICVPLYFHFVAYRVPLHIQIRNSVITFALWVALFWFGFRFGRAVEIIVIILMLLFIVVAWFYVR